ncbi:hypothetical protein KCU81_g828, partial [Aureobasidium melanogenum]
LVGTFARISSETFRIVEQADIVALSTCALVFGHTVVSFVALIIVLDNTTFADVLAQLSLVVCFGTLQSTELFSSPDLGDVFLILECRSGGSRRRNRSGTRGHARRGSGGCSACQGRHMTRKHRILWHQARPVYSSQLAFFEEQNV